jgi:hypothetical protein
MAGRAPGSVLIGGAFKPLGPSAGEPVRLRRQAAGIESAENSVKNIGFELTDRH